MGTSRATFIMKKSLTLHFWKTINFIEKNIQIEGRLQLERSIVRCQKLILLKNITIKVGISFKVLKARLFAY